MGWTYMPLVAGSGLRREAANEIRAAMRERFAVAAAILPELTEPETSDIEAGEAMNYASLYPLRSAIESLVGCCGKVTWSSPESWSVVRYTAGVPGEGQVSIFQDLWGVDGWRHPIEPGYARRAECLNDMQAVVQACNTYVLSPELTTDYLSGSAYNRWAGAYAGLNYCTAAATVEGLSWGSHSGDYVATTEPASACAVGVCGDDRWTSYSDWVDHVGVFQRCSPRVFTWAMPVIDANVAYAYHGLVMYGGAVGYNGTDFRVNRPLHRNIASTFRAGSGALPASYGDASSFGSEVASVEHPDTIGTAKNVLIRYVPTVGDNRVVWLPPRMNVTGAGMDGELPPDGALQTFRAQWIWEGVDCYEQLSNRITAVECSGFEYE